MQQLVSDIQTFEKGASEFSLKQGGLYSARFDNEFAENGVNGTTSRALIDGLQTGNVDKVHAVAEVLAANAADVAGNMLGIGQAPPAAMGKGIPAISTRWRRSAPCLTTRLPSSLAASIQAISSPFTMILPPLSRD